MNSNELKSRGLGDTVAKITAATKMDKLAKKIAELTGNAGCGCDKRQETLNKWFPYKNGE